MDLCEAKESENKAWRRFVTNFGKTDKTALLILHKCWNENVETVMPNLWKRPKSSKHRCISWKNRECASRAEHIGKQKLHACGLVLELAFCKNLWFLIRQAKHDAFEKRMHQPHWLHACLKILIELVRKFVSTLRRWDNFNRGEWRFGHLFDVALPVHRELRVNAQVRGSFPFAKFQCQLTRYAKLFVAREQNSQTQLENWVI